MKKKNSSFILRHRLAFLSLSIIFLGFIGCKGKSKGSSPPDYLVGLWIQDGLSDQQATALAFSNNKFSAEGNSAIADLCKTEQPYSRSGSEIVISAEGSCKGLILPTTLIAQDDLKLTYEGQAVVFKKVSSDKIQAFLSALGRSTTSVNPGFNGFLSASASPTPVTDNLAQFANVVWTDLTKYSVQIESALAKDQSGRLRFTLRNLIDPSRWLAPVVRNFFVFQDGIVHPEKEFRPNFGVDQSFCIVVAKENTVDIGMVLQPTRAITSLQPFAFIEYADQGRRYLDSGKAYIAGEISQRGDKLFDRVTCFKSKENVEAKLTALDLARALGPYASLKAQ